MERFSKDFKVHASYSLPVFIRDAIKHFGMQEGLNQSEFIRRTVEAYVGQAALEAFYQGWLVEQVLVAPEVSRE